MGRDKALLDFGGVPLIQHTARLLGPLVDKVTIVGSSKRYEALGLRAIADGGAETRRRAHQRPPGPLTGIVTALATTRSQWNLIVACDLPYLSAEWLDWLLSRALRSRGEAVVPRTERGIEPLAAVYRRECAEPITAALAEGVQKVSDAVERLRVEFVEPREWRHCDPRGLVLRNMNGPRDYEDARKWWASTRSNRIEHVRKPPRARMPKERSAPRRNK
jgi:molybdopterin-guanine dinucleotide biosynthesis protein A